MWIWLLDDGQLGDVECGICQEEIEPGTRVAWSSTESCIKPWVVDGVPTVGLALCNSNG